MRLPLLALALTAACAPQVAFEIPLSAQVDGSPLVCGAPTGIGEDAVTVRDARLFISELSFLTAEGEAISPTLSADDWQTAEAALLDFEDGCAGGSAGTNTSLRGEVDEGSYVGLTFTVGLPLELNHANPAEAEGPLADTSMHWTWQAGYKFIRLDYGRSEAMSAEVETTAHLGSTNCEGSIGDISGCGRPNRPQVSLDGDPLDMALTLELAPLLVTGGCMSTTREEGCVPFYDALGMDLESGEATGLAEVFAPTP